MPEDHLERLLRDLQEAEVKRRGYADFFEWPIDRSRGELGVVESLAEALRAQGQLFFEHPKSRPRGDDPPDVEALDFQSRRIAIEVTELVDGAAIQAAKAGERFVMATWTRERFVSLIHERLSAKAERVSSLRDGPYPGGYTIVLHTDERALLRFQVSRYLQGEFFPELGLTHRAFLLLSYDPMDSGYPVFELPRGA